MRRIALFPPLTLLWLAVSGPIHAQDQTAQSSTSTSATANSSSQSNDSSAAKSTEKKVWTNDDLENLDGQTATGAIKSNPASSPKNTPKSTPVKGRDAKSYRTEIEALQAKIPPLDQQIHDLQAALSGEPVSSTPHYAWPRQDDWHSQLTRLEKERADIESKIANLEDEARHDGVPANTLP